MLYLKTSQEEEHGERFIQVSLMEHNTQGDLMYGYVTITKQDLEFMGYSQDSSLVADWGT